ncbi:unnamed protein product [Acanthosepion pharaonis]|uniref:SPARC/Testican calcium-binding domain-containing protein n=1 Tax=Acanthosepion pharaonis TaxID=158019 RepID=A0A812AQ79_ACAPH|nr:unnamed protein product [Sepia pharaonis]
MRHFSPTSGLFYVTFFPPLSHSGLVFVSPTHTHNFLPSSFNATYFSIDPLSFLGDVFFLDTSSFLRDVFFLDTSSFLRDVFFLDTSSFLRDVFFLDTSSFLRDVFFLDTSSFLRDVFFLDTSSFLRDVFFLDTSSFLRDVFFLDTSSFLRDVFFLDTSSFYATYFFLDTSSFYATFFSRYVLVFTRRIFFSIRPRFTRRIFSRYVLVLRDVFFFRYVLVLRDVFFSRYVLVFYATYFFSIRPRFYATYFFSIRPRKVKRPRNRRRRKGKRGCTKTDREIFNSNLISEFAAEYYRETPKPTEGTTLATGESKTSLNAAQKRIVDWKFTQLDKDKDHILKSREVRSLKRLVKKLVKPRRCAKSFIEYCDTDQDKKIISKEWSLCLGLNLSTGHNPGLDGIGKLQNVYASYFYRSNHSPVHFN